ncbi:MAG: type II toxin-antitoxin system YhaV family toxin [Pseudomonadota bacterium]|nr:type II toxin-antitoxin system YhaV family toxin [Pseudomonadota bacterium]
MTNSLHHFTQWRSRAEAPGSKRACESKTDAYQLFKQMQASGDPPDDWNQLLAQCRA